VSEAPRHDVPTGGRSGFVDVDGRQVHYLEWGHRGLPPMLCLHGGGQTAYMYEELGAALAGRAHVLAPDLPGHGDSARLAVDLGAISMPKAIAAGLDPLLDTFGMDRVVIVGASLGGMTALVFGAATSDRVAGIVLIDVGHKLEPEGVRKIVDFMTAHESFASLQEAAEAISEYLPNRRAVRPESLTRNLRQRPDGRWEWKHGVGARMREAQAAGIEVKHPADNLDNVLEGIEDAARAIRCPVLLLRGQQSDVLSDDGADELIRVIPDATLEIVEKAGHLAAGDNPHSTTSLVTAFLDRLDW
jgi:pimeloyl-ACP methyl ester carboxylesterase